MHFGFIDFVRLLRRNWITIATAVFLSVAVAFGITASTQPVYSASSQLFVSIQGSGSVTELNQGSLFTQERVQTYVETVRTPAVLDPVVEQLKLDESSEELAQNITAEAEPNTVLLTISAQDHSPKRAAEIANSVGDSLKRVVTQLEKPESEAKSPVQVSTIKPATVPTSAAAPVMWINLSVGLLVGIVLGLTIALLRYVFDTRIRSEEGLARATDAPILGRIPEDGSTDKLPLIGRLDPQSPLVESFKQLRTNLQFSGVGNHSQSILFTSSLPEEGKTTTTVNMAASLADAGLRVLLIDGDLRRPRVAKYLGLETSVGLTTYLIGQAALGDVIQYWGEREMCVLASGRIPPNPSELLGSTEMQRLIQDACNEFDIVLIDGPPLLPVADSAVISKLVSGTVVVVGAHKAKIPEVERAMNALQLVGSRIIGVVLNRLPVKGTDSYRYTYYRSESNDHNGFRNLAADQKSESRLEGFGGTDGSNSPQAPSSETKDANHVAMNPPAFMIRQGEEPPVSSTHLEPTETPTRRSRRRQSNLGFDLVDSGNDENHVVTSSSRPYVRSPAEDFDSDVLGTNVNVNDRKVAPRHVRR